MKHKLRRQNKPENFKNKPENPFQTVTSQNILLIYCWYIADILLIYCWYIADILLTYCLYSAHILLKYCLYIVDWEVDITIHDEILMIFYVNDYVWACLDMSDRVWSNFWNFDETQSQSQQLSSCLNLANTICEVKNELTKEWMLCYLFRYYEFKETCISSSLV